MLNKEKKRELAYIVRIDAIEPIEGSDHCEAAVVGGWKVMVKKEEFKPGDLAIYFEIDSKLPADNPAFSFMEKKHYAVKTQKYTFGGKGLFFSQGLVMKLSDVGFRACDGCAVSSKDVFMNPDDESRFVTEALGVTYYIPEDNVRKSHDPNAKYKSMASRHPKLFRNKLIKRIYKTEFGKKVLFVFFGKRNDSGRFPKHFEYVHVTDEERVENMPWVLQDKRKLIATEKLDGTSTTFILERKPLGRYEFYVLSRNVRQMNADQECYHDYNIHWEMAKKYYVYDRLKQYMIDNKSLKYVALQGESVGSVQGNPLKLKEDDFYGFNFIRSDVGRISSIDGREILESWGMKWVPILSTEWVNPDAMEEMKELATGKSAVNPGVLREGIVYRDENDNRFSFKNVSREYLISKKE